MTPREIVERRLGTQHLSAASTLDPVDLVRELGAVQAQEYGLATWSLAQRTVGQDAASIQAAYDAGAILRTHVLRPTWHFVAPEDLRWIQLLTRERVLRQTSYYERAAGIDDALSARACDVFADRLTGGRSATRAELGEALAAAGLSVTAAMVGFLVTRGELANLLTSGPGQGGRSHTYALLEERVTAPGRDLRGDDALGELAARYFTSHGPASEKDLAWWASLTLTQVRRGISVAGERLASAEVDGSRYWFAAEQEDPLTPATAVQLIQVYDEYVVAYATPSRALAYENAGVAWSKPDAFAQPVLAGTQAVGTWRAQSSRGGPATVQVELAVPGVDPEQAEAAAHRFLAHHGVQGEVGVTRQ